MTDLKLGVDICFGKKRWPLPESWMDIVKNKLEVDIIEFDSDYLDPFFTQEESQLSIAGEIKELADKKSILIHNYFTGDITHCLNMFSHPDERIASRGKEWFEKAIEIATVMGAGGIGSHFSTIPSNIIGTKKYKSYVDEKVETIIELSELAYARGHRFLILEQMYNPSEPPYTIRQTYEMFEKINARAKIRINPLVDLGHSCCQNFDHSPEDRDPYMWLKEFGALSEVIHVQQTNHIRSHHWPFTEEYNSRGIINAEKVIKALEKSGSKKNYLILEIFFSLNDSDEKVISSMIETVNYWKEYI